MNSGKSKVDLQGLISFRQRLRTRTQQVSEQENATRRAINVVSQSWDDGNFKDFDQLDTIQTALIEIHNNRARENMRYKESKRKLEASSATSAAKADSSASGGK